MEMFMWKETNGYHHHHHHHGHNPTMMSSCASSSAVIGLGYIQHPISKLDTLAGIAIKYGVEVADIKKLNGLVTDRQMFALKTLHIPLHGRNSNGNSPSYHASHELLESFQSPRMKSSEQKLSSAMNSTQGCYGTVPAMKESIREVLEIVMCTQGSSNSSENGSFYAISHMSDQPQSQHKKSRSLAERNFDDIMESSDKWMETIAKNLEADRKDTPELLLRQDNSNSCGLSSRTGKGLAQRQKAASRITLTTTKAATMGVGDAYISSSVRKSSSTSCLQGNNNSSIYMRPTSRRSLKPDLIAASTASMAKPILTGGRNKAALD